MTKWKFKIGDIIIWSPDDNRERALIAKVIDRRNRIGTGESAQYRLLFLGNSADWDWRSYTEQDFKKLNWNIKFFDLFMK